jgi:hypothetical protein
LTLQWFVAGAGLLVALAALAWVRRLSRKLERLSQSYWELRYEHGQVTARLARLEPPDGSAPEEPKAPAQMAFVPLSSLKK